MIGFIDPPGRYQPRKEWEDFLKQMKAYPQQDDPQVQWAVKKAEEVLSLPWNQPGYQEPAKAPEASPKLSPEEEEGEAEAEAWRKHREAQRRPRPVNPS